MKYGSSHTVPLAFIREALAYDPATGQFTWLTRPRSHFNSEWAYARWNPRYAGKPAGRYDSKGYLVVNLGPAVGSLSLHRIAWTMMTGEWPQHTIDHINRIRDDNRWKNLREATKLEQLQNRRPYRTHWRVSARARKPK